MIARFFIDRPIFASVVSIMIALTGSIALAYLPIAQYPRITPPGVAISISYPGASAQEVAEAVGAPIEQQVTGVEGMLYMSSQSGNDGSYSLTVTFDIKTDLNTALVMVQNRVALAMPQLPTAVQNQGITIRKRTPDMLMIVSFYSPDRRYNDEYLSNFATIYCKDELLRVDGISDCMVQGQRDYSMRIWLDPQRLAAHNINASDVANAIGNQNIDAPAGRVGSPPISTGQAFQLPLDTLGRLSEPEQFGDIIVKIGGKPPVLTPSGKMMQPPATPSSGSNSNSLMAMVQNALNQANSSTSSGSSTTAPASDASTAASSSSPTDNSSGSTSTDSSSDASTSSSTAASSGSSGGGSMSASSGSQPANPSQTGAAPTSGTVGNVGNSSGAALSTGPSSMASGVVRLRDLARIELGAQNYNTLASFDGQPAVGLGLYQLPGTNALEVADRVRAKMEQLRSVFPDGLDYKIAYDTTTFISDSVNDVRRTLFEAVGLVAIVVLVFLQSWRAAIIPLLAVPVAIIGTFAVMAAIGFSLNNISLFGLVLAIGIVVDDAIVVVENVERWMERGLEPREATRRAMDEVTGPIVAVGLVLCAVFVPCAFISGITGQFFRQFAVTIAVSTIFSTINSLTFSPAMAAILIKPHHARRDPITWVLDRTLGWFFWLFNRVFGTSTTFYAWSVGKLLRLNVIVLLVYAGLFVLTIYTFQQAPTGFIPQQDQGRLIANLQLADAASLERTSAAVLEAERIARETPGIAHTITNTGLSFLLQANSPNFASMFIILEPFDKRQAPNLRADAIMAHLRREWARSPKLVDAQLQVFNSSPVPGLGVAGGFKFMVEDRQGMGVRALEQQVDNLVRQFKQLPSLSDAKTQFRAKIPQYFLEIDRVKAAALGVSVNDVNQTLEMYLGSLYVNSYNQFGRHWQVTIQADGKFRNDIADINLFQVRNNQGQMVPLSTLVRPKDVGGVISINRYNLYTAAAVNGNVASGVSTGEAIKQIDRIAAETLPLSMRIEWTELMFMEIRAGNTAFYIFILAVISVFLALSALYESWALPLAVILVVPLCLLCSVAGVLFTKREVNIFVQIGFVVLVGLACKNAILIVEFAQQLQKEGRSCFEATKESSRLRLRPILMTSFAFIFGVLPLVYASGAGSEMRRSLGTAVFSGMLGVTLFGIFLTPVFYYVIQNVGATRIFMSNTTRSILSYTIGVLIGGTVGYSLARVGVGILPWGPMIGGLAGVLLIRAAREIGERIRPNT